MRTIFLLLAAALLAPATLAQLPADLDARQAAFFDAVASRDADAVAGHFADDATMHVANRPAVAGSLDIAEFYGRVLRFQQSSEATVERTTVSASGDMAFSVGRVVNEFAGQEGPARYEGKFVLVWQRIDGQWLIVHYGISNDHS
jgi:ketosteroid isomerase-like protein